MYTILASLNGLAVDLKVETLAQAIPVAKKLSRQDVWVSIWQGKKELAQYYNGELK